MIRVDMKEARLVTLTIHGREVNFSEEELVMIINEHLKGKTIQNIEISQKPAVCKGFEVKPKMINKSIFKERRDDKREEETRQLILEAFDEMKCNPDRYAKPFFTMIHKKTWESVITVEEMIKNSKQEGGHIANWVEQALEWAQRIQNGETWQNLCKEPDTEECHRLIIWKNGKARFLGGAKNIGNKSSATTVCKVNFNLNSSIGDTVPNVVYR